MVKIGVLSDTHLEDFSRGIEFLSRLAKKKFADVDMILHAGDVVNHDVLVALQDRDLHVVRGNMDPPVRGVPNRKIITVAGFRIGLIHGWGAPEGIEGRVMGEFADDDLDCLVYGHSHLPTCRREGGVLLFNPGSPTDRRWAPFHSVGILEVGEEIEGRILPLD